MIFFLYLTILSNHLTTHLFVAPGPSSEQLPSVQRGAVIFAAAIWKVPWTWGWDDARGYPAMMGLWVADIDASHFPSFQLPLGVEMKSGTVCSTPREWNFRFARV